MDYFSVSNDTILLCVCLTLCTFIVSILIYKLIKAINKININVSVPNSVVYGNFSNNNEHYVPLPESQPDNNLWDNSSIMADLHSSRLKQNSNIDTSLKEQEDVVDGSSTSNSLDAMRNLDNA